MDIYFHYISLRLTYRTRLFHPEDPSFDAFKQRHQHSFVHRTTEMTDDTVTSLIFNSLNIQKNLR